MPKVQTRQIRMHANLLLDVIKRQAGTLGKAIAEGGMNAADARAGYFHITLGSRRVTLEDDGVGIPDVETITKFWETFGQPPDESDERIYGTFRMGRGQMFAFGKNLWRTSRFSMAVDIESWTDTYDYELTEHGGAAKKGCKIEIDLFEELSPSMLRETEREVKQLLKYMEITNLEVTVNGERISVDPAEEQWTHTLPEGYVRVKRTGNLDVYNMGAYVKSYPQSMYGVGGTVVSQKALRVNFARNDVMVRECKIWKALMKDVKAEARKQIARQPSMNDAERQAMANSIVDGDTDYERAYKARLFTDVCGRHWSIQQIERQLYNYSDRVSLADQGSNLGDTVHKLKTAFILGSDTGDRFDMDLDELIAFMLKVSKAVMKWGSHWEGVEAVSFDKLTEGMDDKHVIIPKEQWTPAEKLLILLLASSMHNLSYKVGEAQGADRRPGRNLLVGVSDTARGWTDGSTYVAFNRRWLTTHSLTLPGILSLHHVLLHELCHDAPDTGTHRHTHEFYQVFHDCEERMLVRGVEAFRQLPKAMDKASMKLKAQQLRDLDYLFSAEQGVAKLTEKIAACAAEAKVK